MCNFEISYNRTHALAVNVDQISALPVVGDFLFWLVISFGLVLSLKLQIELSGIHCMISKGFIFEVSSQPLERREAEKLEITINPKTRGQMNT